MIKKVINKTVQITKPELVKCRANKEFKVGVITYIKPKPPIVETDDTDEPIIHGDPYDRNLPPPQPPKHPKAPSWFQAFQITNTNLLEEILKRLTAVETDVSGLKTDVSDIKDVLKRNNLH